MPQKHCLTHAKFLEKLIAEAVGVWQCHPADIYGSKTAACTQARVALVTLAYRAPFCCTADDVRLAFRWRALDKDYGRTAVTKRHGAFLQNEVYQQRFDRLTEVAHLIVGNHGP